MTFTAIVESLLSYHWKKSMLITWIKDMNDFKNIQ